MLRFDRDLGTEGKYEKSPGLIADPWAQKLVKKLTRSSSKFETPTTPA